MAMQTLAASKQLRSDLASLSALDEAAISTFITLASDQLHVGPAGYKAIAAAAEQAGIDEDAAAVAVDALVQLLAETAKLDLAEPAIREALDGLDVSGAVQDALVQASLEERGAARRVAGSMAHSLPALRRLDWRLDVQVASRCISGSLAPTLTLRLETDGGTNGTASHLVQAELRDVEVICGQLREALQESRSNHARRIARLLK